MATTIHKFTQGPWHVGGVGGCRPSMVYGPNGRTVARTWSPNLADGSEEEKANAALIAAAPDLLEALEKLAGMVPEIAKALPFGVPMSYADAFDKARAAIAAARGGVAA